MLLDDAIADDDNLAMPGYLLEAQETLGEDEVKRYFKNHRQQMYVFWM